MMSRYDADKQETPPEISVIMAVRNGARYLEEALQSLIDQTCGCWEAVLVDDGSTDATAEILASYQDRDARFILLRNRQSIGLAASLNRALNIASGAFIARMDADDICDPERFSTQLAWLVNHPTHVLVGSVVMRIDADGNSIGRTDKPATDEQIRIHMLFENPFIHPTTMWRQSAFRDSMLAYDISFETSQDWDLWRKILPIGKVANIQTVLLKQRFHKESISAVKSEQQHKNSLRVQREYFFEIFEDESWNQELFENINKVFMGDRSNVNLSGPSRAQIAYEALQLIRNMPSAEGASRLKIPDMLIDRAIRTGLYLPITKGWMSLFGLVIRYPLSVFMCLKNRSMTMLFQ